MISQVAEWWSAPVASTVARQWLTEHHLPPVLRNADPSTRERIALDAARTATDTGETELALAYTQLPGLGTPGGGLRFEGAYTSERPRTPKDASSFIDSMREVDDESLIRRLRCGRLSDTDAEALANSPEVRSDVVTIELSLVRGVNALMRMEWAEALAHATFMLSSPRIDDFARVRALIVSAVARLQSGQWEQALSLLDEMQRLMGANRRVPALGASERALALCIQLLAAQTTSRDDSHLMPALAAALSAAVHESDAVAEVLSGLAAGMACARRADAETAVRELDAAMTRAERLASPPWASVLELNIARGIALLGNADEAEHILRRALPDRNDLPLMIEHSRLATECSILSARGHTDEAVEFAAAAAEISGDTGSLPLHAWDLFQLVVLGEKQEDALRRLRLTTPALELPAADAPFDRAAEVIRGSRRMSGGRGPVELLREAAPWSASGAPHSDASGTTARRLAVIGDSAAASLTKREREIAALVDQGLSNREIAQALFLSVRTVESHIYQARQKAHASSRAELGQHLSQVRKKGNGTFGR